MKKKQKEGNENGYKLRLAQAIIYLIIAIALFLFLIFHAVIGYMKWGEYIVLVFVDIFAIFLTILQFKAAKKGRTHLRANNLSIALYGFICFVIVIATIVICCVLNEIIFITFLLCILFGVLGLIGGIQGGKPFREQRRLEKEARKRAEAERAARAQVAAAAARGADGNSGNDGTCGRFAITQAEYIKPKISKKGKTAMFAVLTVSYALLLIAGILLAAVPSLSSVLSDIGICEEACAPAYAITIGVMWVALVPSFGYYFATLSPFELSKKVKIIIAAISTALLAAMVAVFFVIINVVEIEGLAVVKAFYEGSDSWFVPLSMVFAALGMIICYALTLFRINPAKIKDFKPQKSGDGLFATVKYIFISLFGLVLKLVKGILKFKEKQPDIFILVATLLLTWLVFFTAFIFAIICIAVLAGVVIMYFGGVMHWALDKNTQRQAYTFVNDMGCEQTVYSDNGGDFYNADGRLVGTSDDGGKHINLN